MPQTSTSRATALGSASTTSGSDDTTVVVIIVIIIVVLVGGIVLLVFLKQRRERDADKNAPSLVNQLMLEAARNASMHQRGGVAETSLGGASHAPARQQLMELDDADNTYTSTDYMRRNSGRRAGGDGQSVQKMLEGLEEATETEYMARASVEQQHTATSIKLQLGALYQSSTDDEGRGTSVRGGQGAGGGGVRRGAQKTMFAPPAQHKVCWAKHVCVCI